MRLDFRFYATGYKELGRDFADCRRLWIAHGDALRGVSLKISERCNGRRKSGLGYQYKRSFAVDAFRAVNDQAFLFEQLNLIKQRGEIQIDRRPLFNLFAERL